MEASMRYELEQALMSKGYTEEQLMNCNDTKITQLIELNKTTTDQKISLAEGLPVMTRSMQEDIAKATGNNKLDYLIITVELLINICIKYRDSKGYTPEEWTAYLWEAEEAITAYLVTKRAA